MTTQPVNRLWRWLGTFGFWLCWPGLWLCLRLGARTRVLVLAEGHVLLVQSWLGTADWGLPGGGLHRGEQASVGAAREAFEETGIRLGPDQLRPLAAEWSSHRGLGFYCHFFAAQLDHQPQLHRQRGEITQAEWVPLTRVRELPLKCDVLRALELLQER